jgi:hemerythrin-like domain-containing protein
MNTTTSAARATDILKAEHEVILSVLDCLEKLADDVRGGGALDLLSAREVLDFLGTFADKCHHGKEEGALFPMLGTKGLPTQVGPVAVMLAEHELGRAEIAGMRAEIAGPATVSAERALRFAVHANTYVDLLRDHIAKENNVLFPMADGMLAAAEQEQLLREFGKVETHDLGAGTHERYLALADGLVARLGVTPSPRRSLHAGGCCGGPTGCR